MLVQSSKEFWDLNSCNNIQGVLEVVNPKVVQSIMLRHKFLKFLAYCLFSLALLTPILAISIDNNLVLYLDGSKGNALKDYLVFLKLLIPYFMLTTILSIVARIADSLTIQGRVIVTSPPLKLMVSHLPRNTYTSKLLGLKFRAYN